MRIQIHSAGQSGKRGHGKRSRVASLLFALGLVLSSVAVSPVAAAGPGNHEAKAGFADPELVQLTGTINRHCNDGISLLRPEFQSTIYQHWSTAWHYSLIEEGEFPLGDYDYAIGALRAGISAIENTPACNAAEAKYKLDLLETLSWHIAFDVCRKHHQAEYLTTRDFLGDVVMLTNCSAFPLSLMQSWFQLASEDMIAASQSTCDPGYTEPPVGALDGELLAALYDGFYTVLELDGTLQDLYEDPQLGVTIIAINLTLDDLRQHDPGGAGGSFSVEVVAHTTTDLTILSGTVTSPDLGQGASLTLNPNVANINTVAALHHSVPVTVVGTLTLNGQSPVTVTIPNNSTFTWPYAAGATYHPLDTTSLVDTQSPDPAKNIGGRITAKVARSFQVAGLAGVPDNATAVTGNLTVKGQSAAGWLALTRSSAVPTVSTLNFQLDTRANGVTARLDRDGRLWVYYGAVDGATTDFVFDVSGYYVRGDSTGQKHQNLPTPYRLVDTRSTDGKSQNLGGKLTAGVPKSFQVTGLTSPFPSIPSTATAVAGNLTVTAQSAAGSISLTNSSATPTIQTLHFQPTPDSMSVGVTAKLDPSGKLWLTYQATAAATTHVVFDITGYFVAGGGGLYYYPVTPVRTVDTRGTTPGAQTLGGKLTAKSAKSFMVAGFAGVPALNQQGRPYVATGNLTVTGQTAAGWLALTNAPTTPTVSTLNFLLPPDNRANMASVQLGGVSGVLYVYYGAGAGNTTHVIFDLTGFYSSWSSY